MCSGRQALQQNGPQLRQLLFFERPQLPSDFCAKGLCSKGQHFCCRRRVRQDGEAHLHNMSKHLLLSSCNKHLSLISCKLNQRATYLPGARLNLEGIQPFICSTSPGSIRMLAVQDQQSLADSIYVGLLIGHILSSKARRLSWHTKYRKCGNPTILLIADINEVLR